jgi:hypothetical protein
MYKTTRMVKFDNTECNGVVRISDYAVIPEDDTSGAWDEYLAWLAEGNTPEEWSPNGNQ